jgi:4-hydroxybenzoate polyprenyltransferase
MMRAKLIAELRPALIAVGFLLMASKLLAVTLTPFPLLAGFFAAFAVYFADHELPKKHRLAWPGILLASLGFGFFAWKSNQLSWMGIGFYVLLSFAYVFRWFPGKRRLQDFPRLRVLAIAGGWAALPLLLNAFTLHRSSGLYLIGMTAFMLPAIVWSDLADANSDQRAGRKTLAVSLSERGRTRLILSALLLALACCSLPSLQAMLPGPLIYLGFFRFFNRQPQYSDWVLLWPLIGSIDVLVT